MGGTMADELPSEERVRELTADPDLTAEEAGRHGDQFAQAGKYAVALMFYERSKDRARLEALKKKAVEMGDAFLLMGITRLAADLVKAEEWREAGDRARKAGKLLFAKDCYEQAGDPESAQAAREEWLKIFPQPAAAPVKAAPPTAAP
jgi:tetratricopeptide (TPR) repeat protein